MGRPRRLAICIPSNQAGPVPRRIGAFLIDFPRAEEFELFDHRNFRPGVKSIVSITAKDGLRLEENQLFRWPADAYIGEAMFGHLVGAIDVTQTTITRWPFPFSGESNRAHGTAPTRSRSATKPADQPI